MRFRVLGTTELLANGSSARIGSERKRRLLAALVMRTPATVPADALIEAVWGDDSPDNAVSALRTVVTRLRHSLDDQESGSGRCVVARPPGYVLEVPEDSIDANRFADLAVLGRRHLADGNMDAARTALDEALGLWHGRPYAEFGDEDWAQAEALWAFQEYRTTLVEKLGLEPGPELAQWHLSEAPVDASWSVRMGRSSRGYRADAHVRRGSPLSGSSE